jgi:hypothetical protein
MIGLQNSPRARSPHCCQVLAKFSADPTTKFRNLAKISTIFLAFCCYVTKSCWGTKEVLFELFPLNKFVFNTPNKNFSQAVSFCSAVFFGRHCILIINMFLKNNTTTFPLKFCSNFSP